MDQNPQQTGLTFPEMRDKARMLGLKPLKSQRHSNLWDLFRVQDKEFIASELSQIEVIAWLEGYAEYIKETAYINGRTAAQNSNQTE